MHSASLIEARRNLEHERFVVAVSGQMNSGKSTLLNALLFRRPVLPHAPTTMTAKIAILQGAECERLEGTLYTPPEFDGVVRAAAASTIARAELAEARDAARRSGIRENKILTSPPRIERSDDLADLARYVAVPNLGGTLTPYVKSVSIWADRPWLHQVMVADTPGTNDSNPERDRLTKEWINRADAVVYVTYAGQAGLDADDVKFIDTYLRHIDPRKRIIAVNKCDTQDDADAIRSHFRQFASSRDLRLQELFADPDQIVLVSGLAGLITAMNEDGTPIPSQFAEEAEFLEFSGWLEPGRSGIDALSAKVEERIISTRGADLLLGHRNRIEATFEQATRRAEEERSEAMEALGALSATKEERDAERARLKASFDLVDELVGDANGRVEAARRERADGAEDELREVCRSLAAEVVRSLEDIPFQNLAENAQWSVPRAIRLHRSEIIAPLRGLFDAAEQALDDAESALSEQLLAGGFAPPRSRRHILSVSATTLVRDAEKELRQTLEAETLKGLIKDSTIFWKRWWNPKAGRTPAITAVLPELERVLFDAIDDCTRKASENVRVSVAKAMEELASGVNSVLEDRRLFLQRLEHDERDEGQLRAEYRASVEGLASELGEIQALHAAFADAMEE